jgi:hypothetical protein
MNRYALAAAFLAALMLSSTPAAHAQQTRVSGLTYFDAQYSLAGGSVADDSSFFRVRRIYVTLDRDLDTTFAVRVQLEADENTFASNGKNTVLVKQANVRWRGFGGLGLGDLVFGLSATPSWSLAEAQWGYRSLEKTVMDRGAFGTATDLGIAVQRVATKDQPLGWHLMIGNGTGQKPEDNAGKKAMAALSMRSGELLFEGGADYEDGIGALDKWSLRGLGVWANTQSALGLEAYRRVHVNAGGPATDVIPMGVSAWGRHPLNKAWKLVGRVDWTDPDSENDLTGHRETMFLVGLDAMPHAQVHVIPNVQMRTYQAKGTSGDKDTDIAARLTVHWNY